MEISSDMKNHKLTSVSDGKVITLCMMLSISIFIVDSIIPLGVAGGIPYIFVVLVSLWSPREKLPYYVATGVSLLTIIAIYSSPPGGELWKVIFNRSLALCAIWITAFLSVQRKSAGSEREKALSEIRVLQGIISICSYCHNIRDDEGAWNRLEAYITEHSEVQFSHGICPNCVAKVRLEAGLDKPG